MRLGQLLGSIKFCLSIQKFCSLQTSTIGNARGWVNLQDCLFRPHLFLGVQSLFLKTEALNLIEVEAGLKGDHIVRRYSCHWPVGWVPSCVERQGCFPWNHLAGEGEGNMHQDVRACSSISFPDQVQSMVADLGMRYGNVATR